MHGSQLGKHSMMMSSDKLNRITNNVSRFGRQSRESPLKTSSRKKPLKTLLLGPSNVRNATFTREGFVQSKTSDNVPINPERNRPPTVNTPMFQSPPKGRAASPKRVR